MPKCPFKSEYRDYNRNQTIIYLCPHPPLKNPDRDGKKRCIFHSDREDKDVEKFFKGFKKLYEDGSHIFPGFIFPKYFSFKKLKEENGPLKFVDAVFRRAYFICNVDLSEAEFIGEGENSFYGASFNGEKKTSFFKTKFFSDFRTDFMFVHFSSNSGADFCESQFLGKGEVRFCSVEFASRDGTDFSYSNFTCEGKTDFSDSQFSGKGVTNFHSAKFLGMGGADFSTVEFFGKKGVNFRKTEFLIEPIFDFVRFLKIPDFSETKISGKPNFNWIDFLEKNDCYITFSSEVFKNKFMEDEDKIMNPTIFVSHSTKDKPFVRELAKRLEKFRIKAWIDEAEIKIGESLTKKIGEAIVDTDYVAAVISNNSINSEWVQKELEIAMNKEIEHKKVVVLPLLIEEIRKEDMPPFLRDKLYADFTNPDSYERSFKKLLKTLGIETV